MRCSPSVVDAEAGTTAGRPPRRFDPPCTFPYGEGHIASDLPTGAGTRIRPRHTSQQGPHHRLIREDESIARMEQSRAQKRNHCRRTKVFQSRSLRRRKLSSPHRAFRRRRWLYACCTHASETVLDESCKEIPRSIEATTP